MTKENLYYKTGVFLLVLAVVLRLCTVQGVQRQISDLAGDRSFTSLLLHMELGVGDKGMVGLTEQAPEQDKTLEKSREPAQNNLTSPPREAWVEQAPELAGQTIEMQEPARSPEPAGQAMQAEEQEQVLEESALEPSQPDQEPVSPPTADPFDPRILVYAPGMAVLEPEPDFTAKDLEAIGTLNNDTDYDPDLEALLHMPVELPGDNSQEPWVLIIHTHGTESYTPAAEGLYEESDPFHTLDMEYNVTGLGTVLAEGLQAAGIGVVHDTAYHDYPAYDGSYTRTGERIRELMEQYPSIGLVIDLHRDCVQNSDGGWMATAEDPDGPARLMLVVGTDAGGLSHPDWQKNLTMALQVQALTLRRDGNLCRSVNLRTERFNQQLAPTILVEIGACGDTWDQAARTVQTFGQALAAWLVG